MVKKRQFKVAKAMKKKTDKVKDTFICGLGDMTIYGAGVTCVDDPQFQEKSEIPYRDINVPFYMCLGNHDYGYSNKCLIPQKNAFNQVKYTQKSDKWMIFHLIIIILQAMIKMREFFVLDTNLDMMSERAY